MSELIDIHRELQALSARLDNMALRSSGADHRQILERLHWLAQGQAVQSKKLDLILKSVSPSPDLQAAIDALDAEAAALNQAVAQAKP